MMPNRAATIHLLAAIFMTFCFAIPLQEREDNSNDRAPSRHFCLSPTSASGSVVPLQERRDNSAHGVPPPGITYVIRSYYTIHSIVTSKPLPRRPDGLPSWEDAEEAADGTLLNYQSLHEPLHDRELAILEENDGILLAAGGEAEPVQFRLEKLTTPGAAEQFTMEVRHVEETTKPAPATYASVAVAMAQKMARSSYNNYNYNNTYNDSIPRWDNRHQNVGLTTALIGPSASSPAATTTIDYPVDGALNPDLRAHIDHRRADNHDWQQ
ncbi:hypothetical protein DL765_005034 [Monosporascus sp. GIB2]|nr:hypothetical protein DL765_005034 [Monosporascus sp. GIB2]